MSDDPELNHCARCKTLFLVGEIYTEFCKSCLRKHYGECQVILANQLLAIYSQPNSINLNSKTSKPTSGGPKKK